MQLYFKNRNNKILLFLIIKYQLKFINYYESNSIINNLNFNNFTHNFTHTYYYVLRNKYRIKLN